MQYRREIDGLRAVAVLPVILFHAGFSFWSGGFVGVDVFFVISGYLITTILIDDRARGTYSLWRFYERRARRILPALFCVFAVCIVFAWLWIPPLSFVDFARSLGFSALFISNVHFIEHGGYFDVQSEFRPLLHTWSLSVEEQFYLLFPLVLIALRGFRRAKYFVVFAIMALASLAVAEWGWRNYPDENFYFTPSRLWELLAGSLCAVLLYQRAPKRHEGLAALGLFMILGATVGFDASIPFPSVYALVPVVGTCLIILYAAEGTWTAKALSLKPLVFVGLISYSAYLWHQPLFAFARIRMLGDVPEWLLGGLAVTSLGLAYLTWRFVEQPFRGTRPLFLPSRRAILGASVAGIAAFAVFGQVSQAKHGFVSRMNAGQSAYLATLLEKANTVENAACPGMHGLQLRDLCKAVSQDNAARKIAVIGDSHAGMLMPAMQVISEDLNADIFLGYRSVCPPILGASLAKLGKRTELCRTNMQRYAEQIRDMEIDTVLLVARWSLYTYGDYNGPSTRFRLVSERGLFAPSAEEALIEFNQLLDGTITFFQEAGTEVILVGQVPQQKTIPALVVQNAMLRGISNEDARDLFEDSFVPKGLNDRIQTNAKRAMIRAAKEHKVRVIFPEPLFSEGDRYVWLRGDDAYYTDDDHLSPLGSRLLAPLLLRGLAGPVGSCNGASCP